MGKNKKKSAAVEKQPKTTEQEINAVPVAEEQSKPKVKKVKMSFGDILAANAEKRKAKVYAKRDKKA